MRPLLPLLLPLALLLLAAPAWAEEEAAGAPAVEVFVLDNGYMVQGRVIRDEPDKLVVRLSGLLERNTITLRRSEIRERRVHMDPTVQPLRMASDVDAAPSVAYGGSSALPQTTRYDADGNEQLESLPEKEPTPESESFGERLVRVTRMAFPASFEGRLLVGFLALLAFSVIVGGSARLLGMKAPSLHASTTLGFLLGLFLLGDILLHDELLRADRALWVLPLQFGVWIATARALLDAPLARIVPLFSIVLVVATSLMFLTGSLLVSL